MIHHRDPSSPPFHRAGLQRYFMLVFRMILLYDVSCEISSTKRSAWQLAINYKPITRQQILGSSKLKEFADDYFKFDENGRKLSKRVENTVGKGEIARYEQFLFSHSVFKRLVSHGSQKVSLCGNGLNSQKRNSI